jgi:hypothetical protein
VTETLTSRFEVRPASPSIGAEIQGVDFTQPVDEATAEAVPLENRIRLVTCKSSGRQAAREYSLIRPPRTGFR